MDALICKYPVSAEVAENIRAALWPLDHGLKLITTSLAMLTRHTAHHSQANRAGSWGLVMARGVAGP